MTSRGVGFPHVRPECASTSSCEEKAARSPLHLTTPSTQSKRITASSSCGFITDLSSMYETAIVKDQALPRLHTPPYRTFLGKRPLLNELLEGGVCLVVRSHILWCANEGALEHWRPRHRQNVAIVIHLRKPVRLRASKACRPMSMIRTATTHRLQR